MTSSGKFSGLSHKTFFFLMVCLSQGPNKVLMFCLADASFKTLQRLLSLPSWFSLTCILLKKIRSFAL